jgi:hypothetical protein
VVIYLIGDTLRVGTSALVNLFDYRTAAIGPSARPWMN